MPSQSGEGASLIARKLEVQIVGDASSFTRAAGSAASSADHLGKRVLGSFGTIGKAALFTAGAAGLGAVALTLRAGIKEWTASAQAASQTEAVIKSTGGAANVTAAGVDALSKSILAKTGIDDEAVKSGENMLLTFTEIQNRLGRNNDIFTQATKVTADLSVAMGMDMSKAALQVGKALNDPARGMSRLQRIGVAFTKDQKDAVAAMMKMGDTAGAQKVILKELNKEFGGSAEAYGRTLPGKIGILREQFNNLAGDLVGMVAPSFARALGAANSFMSRINQAQGWRAKLSVVVATAENAAQVLQDKIGAAVAAVDWTAVWSKAKGIGAGLQAKFESISWGAVGQKIGDGISTAVDKAISGTKGLPTKILHAADSIDWNALGRKMGPGLAAAVASAIAVALSPGFWLKNWDLALAIGLAVFPFGRILKLGARLGPVFGEVVLSTAAWIERYAPRLASAFLGGMLKLPGLLGRVGSMIAGLVGKLFDRLGGLAKFTIKVLGIREAINAVVGFAQDAWNAVKKLPGQMLGLGKDIVSGLVNGILSAGPDLVRSAVDSVAGKIPSWARKLLGISSPSRVMFGIGQNVTEGLALGILDRAADAERAMVGTVGRTLRAARAEVARLQAAMDADAARRQDADNARALRDAETALAVARKKNKDVADAMKAVADAQQAIKDTAAQRELDKAQKHLDRVQGQFDRAQAKLQAAQERAAAKLQAIRDRALAAFDKVAGKIQRAFDAKNADWISPAQTAINAITNRRTQEDLQQAVADAQQAVLDAQASGDTSQIISAQRTLARAIEDIQLDSYSKQNEQQSKAHDQFVAAQQEQLDATLEAMRQKLEKGKGIWSNSLTDMLAAIGAFDGDFATIGATLGDAFAKSLMDAVNAAVVAANAASGATRGRGSVRPDDRAGPRGAGVSSVSSRASNDTYNINVPGYLGDQTTLNNAIVSGIATAKRQGRLLDIVA